jgi:hypothetical protein
MSLKTFVAASVIAFLPAMSFASITVNSEGVDGVQLNALSGSVASTSDTLGGASGLLLGPAQALDWNMRVINVAPPGAANTDGAATYRFNVLQNATVFLTSTQNPFAGLDNLSLDLLLNGNNVASVSSYTFGAFAAAGPIIATAGDVIDVVSSWSGITGLFTEIEVDFVLYARAGNNPGDVPLPATALLLVGALGGLGWMARKRA